ncbi:MAG: prephenate dehydratase, partial [Pseudomonadota bacterium]|nr:prephenate dehydratase [Pseudomonadota bacterium]
FLVMAREPWEQPPNNDPTITTIVFRLRNVPAALYKSLGGFATNGVNMFKLESYMLGGEFAAVQFYCDLEGHPEDPPVRRALEELDFFAREVRVLGVYPASPFRFQESQNISRNWE